MKRKLSLLLCLLLAMFAFPSAARADMGPKPSLEITFSGLEGETYYVGLLGYEPGEDTPFARRSLRDALTDGSAVDDEAILQKFAAYQDADGLIALDLVENCSVSHHYSAGRFPPSKFKVLLYFPETDHFVVSDRIYSTYAFYTFYSVDAFQIGLNARSSGTMDLGMRNAYRYGATTADFLFRLVLTLAIELGIAWLFRLRGKRVFRFIVIVNVITQTLLTASLTLVNYINGSLAAALLYIVLETAVFLLEGILYAKCLKPRSECQIPAWKPWIYAWVANTASFFAGVYLMLVTG